MTLERSRPSSSKAAAIRAFIGGLALTGVCVFGESAEWPGALVTQLTGDRGSEVPAAWKVEYLGKRDPPEYANGNNWRFRATHVRTGETKLFRSGTDMGYFVTARTYQSMVLIGADLGSGAWGFTIYDLDRERKVREFWAGFPHLSPDGRYLVYRRFYRRNEPMDPRVLLADLGREFGDVAPAHASQGIGDVVFPPPASEDRPEFTEGYGTAVTSFRFKVAWDMENGVLFFTASDRTGHLNLVVLLLEPSPTVVCYVPLTHSRLDGEYFERKKVNPQAIAIRSPNAVVVTTTNGFGVTSEHHVSLSRACWEQNQAFAEGVRGDRNGG